MEDNKATFAERVELLVEQWNCLVDELKNAAKFAAPELSSKYDEAIAELIAYREAARRGLLELDELTRSTETHQESSHGEE